MSRLNQNPEGVLVMIGNAIIETVKETGPDGAPAGPMYAAMMSIGLNIDQFEAIMSGLVQAGRLRKSGNLYFAVDGK